MKRTLITAVAVIFGAAVANEAQAYYPKTVREKYTVHVHKRVTVGVTTPTFPVGVSPVTTVLPTPVSGYGTPGFAGPGFVAPTYGVMPATHFGSTSAGYSASYSRETTYAIPKTSRVPTRRHTRLPGRGIR